MPSSPTSTDLSFDELVRSANAFVGDAEVVDARTVRFWRSEGLVSAPQGTGRGARWGWRHVLEVAYIRRRQHDGTKLIELRNTTDVDDEQLADVIEAPPAQPEGWQPPSPSASSAFWDQPLADTAAGPSFGTSAIAGAPPRARSVMRQKSLDDGSTSLVSPARPAPRTLVELDNQVAVAFPAHISNNPAAMAALAPSLDALSRAVANLTEQPS